MAFRVVVRNEDVDGGTEELLADLMEDAPGEEGAVIVHLVHPDHTRGLARTIRHADILSTEEIELTTEEIEEG